jgi:hypothetical protein
MEHVISQCSLMDLTREQSKHNIQLLSQIAQNCTHEKLRSAAQNALAQSIDLQQTLWQHLHEQNYYEINMATDEDVAYARRHITELYMARDEH